MIMNVPLLVYRSTRRLGPWAGLLVTAAALIAPLPALGDDRGLLERKPAHPARIIVNCDRGQRLASALKRARPGSTVLVKGTCYEQVKITTPGLRLRGLRGAVIDGGTGPARYEGTVTVSAAKGVVLADLEVRNGPDQGIVIQRGASAALRNVSARDNATTGISVDASYAEFDNVTASANGGGFDVFTGAVVIAKGPLAANGNTGSGLAVNSQSTFELRGAVVETSDNGGDGVTVVNDSQLIILSFPESQGSGIQAHRNRGSAGIFVAGSSLAVVGSQFAGSGANVFEITGNGVGMLFVQANFTEPFATARFNVSNNNVGIILSDNTDAFVVGGLNVRHNGVGMIGDGAGVVRLQNNDDNPSAITGNFGADVIMSFGSRLALEPAVDVGSLVCDPTVVTPLPPPPPGEPSGVSCP